MTGEISRWGKKQRKKTSEEKSRWGKKQILSQENVQTTRYIHAWYKGLPQPFGCLLLPIDIIKLVIFFLRRSQI